MATTSDQCCDFAQRDPEQGLLRYGQQWARLEAEIVRLHQAGFSLVPLGLGPDGKAPLLKFKDIPRLPVQRVLAPMKRTQSFMYGVRLDGSVVLDLDRDDDNLQFELEDRFGPARVSVRTPRGLHLYYRALAGNLPNLKAEGLPVDVKSGPNAYVAGPGSRRPSGGEYYYASNAVLGESNLMLLNSDSEPASSVSATSPSCDISAEKRGRVRVGSRNKHLYRIAREVAKLVAGPGEIVEQLRLERDENCQNPKTVTDAEQEKIAQWAWLKRLENSFYEERNSSFLINRSAVDRLRGKPGSSDAKALYLDLVDQHGHCPGRAFGLVYYSMRTASWTDLSRERFLAARRMLETEGLLQKVGCHVRGKKYTQFQLMRPMPDTVERIPS